MPLTIQQAACSALSTMPRPHSTTHNPQQQQEAILQYVWWGV
jgi:hypothetical protein